MSILKRFCLSSVLIFSAIQVQAGKHDRNRSQDTQPPPPDSQYSYYVRVPAGSISCDARATQIADAFQNATGANATGTCAGVNTITDRAQNYSVYSIAVTYMAPRAVRLYSAILGEVDISGPTNVAAGTYEGYEACISDLKNQTARFEANTEISSIAASCEQETWSSIGTLFVMKIDGFGEPVRSLHGFSLSSLYSQSADWRDAAHVFIESKGGEVVRDTEAGVLYYSERGLNLNRHTFGIFHNRTQCESQIAQSEAILNRAQAEKSKAMCVASSDVKYPLISLVAMGLGGASISEAFLGSKIRYFTFDECVNDKNRAMTDYASTYKRSALGAICSKAGATYEMSVYE